MCFRNITIPLCLYELDHVTYFRDLFESISEYREIVLLVRNACDSITDCGFSINNKPCLCFEFKSFLLEQNENYLDYIKLKKNLLSKKNWRISMEQYVATIFEDVRHEGSLILFLSLADPDIIKQNDFTDHEIKISKNLALEKSRTQGIVKG